MNHLIPAEFHGTQINIIDHASRKWLTAEQVGRCLGYDESNSRKGVLKVYERHGDEFAEQDTCVVNLTTQGQGRATRIFSDTGCIKIGFFANTPRAKDFRTWASNKLAHQAGTDVTPAQQLSLAREIGQLRDMMNRQQELIVGLFERLDASRRGHLRAQVQLTNVLQREQRLSVTLEKRQAHDSIIQMEAEGIPRDVICLTTGRTLNHVRQVVFQAKRDGKFPAIQGELGLTQGGAA